MGVAKPPQATAAPAILRAQSVHRAFKMGDSTISILKGVDVTLRHGEFTAIEGRSGSGKSTLLHILGALDESDQGSIEFEGTDFTKLSAAERSRLRNKHFGFIFQFYHLLPELNVLENTMLAPMIEHSWFGYRAQKRALTARAPTHLVDVDVVFAALDQAQGRR